MFHVAGAGETGQGFVHFAEFSSTTHQVSWSQIPDVLLFCPGMPGTYHPAQEAPAQWARAQIVCIFRSFEIVFTDRVSLRRPEASLKFSSDTASLLERTGTGKCGPTALSNTWPEAWGPPRFGHKC